MFQRLWAVLLATLLLAGCGRGGEDFTVDIARPADRVKQELGHIELEPAVASHFPGLRVDRTSSGKDDVLYTLPGDGSFKASIHLTFEPANGGKSTVVHAAIDVPAVKVEFEGKAKQISEFKVELALRKVIEQMREKLEAGDDTALPRKEFSEVLTALAVVTDSKQLALAMDMAKNPEEYMDGLDSLYDGDEDERRADAAAPANGDLAEGEDPNAPARRQQAAAREKADDAAAPMDDAAGDDAKGDGTAPEG